MPMIGFRKSSRVKPTARSIARAAARFGPSVRAVLFVFAGLIWCSPLVVLAFPLLTGLSFGCTYKTNASSPCAQPCLRVMLSLVSSQRIRMAQR
jgi:hypothetical protein